MSIHETFTYQDLEAIRVGRVGGAMTASFILYRLGGTLIDCAPSNQWKYVRPFVKQKQVEQVLITHHHEDHSGNAANIKRMTGITPLAPATTCDILKRGFKIPPWQKMMWGKSGKLSCDPLPDQLQLANGEAVTPIFTPGHAKDMHCYLLPERGWLFSADLYLASYLKMLRSDENAQVLVDSINQVLQQDFEVIVCLHRGVVEGGKQRLTDKRDYILEFAGKVQALHREGMSDRQITHRLLGKESPVSVLTGYNFSKINLVSSCKRISL
ncbi:MAG: MBL fold metallo-hydrolase [Candidatus Pelagadaptatus aseana]|uniref:MBL fold metallo-hydrolase n=1 Tax=Candidatus Pelagadaptatus aseana TaxID=3120508 RepID=UPI0039B34F14